MRGFEREDFCPALLVERDQPLRLRLQTAPRQRFVESVRIVANESNVVHRLTLKTWMAGTSPAMTNQ
ncbi:MAG TPA: hypothetical protein VK337_21260 [Xanthobacteraceae bacterium]|nr:hypothetical protein [Xanthobacteraceae bacterium]